MKCWHLFGSVHLWLAICLWGCVSAFAIGPRGAQNRENLATNLAQRVAPPADAYGGLRLREPLKKRVTQNKVPLDKGRSLEQTESRIRQLSEIEFPNTSAQQLVQSPAQQTVPAIRFG